MKMRFHIEREFSCWVIKDRNNGDQVIERFPTRREARVAVVQLNGMSPSARRDDIATEEAGGIQH